MTVGGAAARAKGGRQPMQPSGQRTSGPADRLRQDWVEHSTLRTMAKTAASRARLRIRLRRDEDKYGVEFISSFTDYNAYLPNYKH